MHKRVIFGENRKIGIERESAAKRKAHARGKTQKLSLFTLPPVMCFKSRTLTVLAISTFVNFIYNETLKIEETRKIIIKQFYLLTYLFIVYGNCEIGISRQFVQ